MSTSDSESSTATTVENIELNSREFDLEDEDQSSSNALRNTDGDFEYGQAEAYENEPLADEEWLKKYIRETEEERRQTEELERRMQNEVPLDSWCHCGNCRVPLLVNPKECRCCHEIANCMIEMQDHMVVSELGRQPKCITEHPGFDAICLNRWALNLAANLYQRQDGVRYHKGFLEQRFFRVVAYRQFTRMVHGILRDKRIPLPACAYHVIRKTFNLKKNEHFAGYEEDNL
ncbi:uncharacterized protein LOC124456292 [Xenia sp. Carnegie-2017]|uniref:uncharacterized protein LOC124456292 n=1 Tax=Xenia sp. Carnegie-2017 TaxID=2897299 RepID=UPI001F04A49F|nr:uncharacterized protein LOC124456292 [Xenia sp. Carnegie-2017]